MDTQKSNSPEGRELVDFAAKRLFERRAVDIQLLDLTGISNITDFYLIGTCQSEPQMRSILTSLKRDLRKAGVKPMGTDYEEGARWAVLDVGELIVHLFEQEARNNYDLNRLWGEAPCEDLLESDYVSEDEQEDDENQYL